MINKNYNGYTFRIPFVCVTLFRHSAIGQKHSPRAKFEWNLFRHPVYVNNFLYAFIPVYWLGGRYIQIWLYK